MRFPTLLSKSDYITIHMPQTNDTKGFINADRLNAMKTGVRIVNFARGGLVNNADMLQAIANGKVSMFVTDFAAEELLANPKVICFPHLGASTPEAEENCAVMAVAELREFLERGTIANSGGTRLCISNKNIPGMVSKFSTILGEASLNIAGMINQNSGNIAYNIIDVEGNVSDDTLAKLSAMENVTHVRAIAG